MKLRDGFGFLQRSAARHPCSFRLDRCQFGNRCILVESNPSGKRVALLPLPPLRTGRETFASSGSSRYKAPRDRSRCHDVPPLRYALAASLLGVHTGASQSFPGALPCWRTHKWINPRHTEDRQPDCVPFWSEPDSAFGSLTLDDACGRSHIFVNAPVK